MIKGLRTSARLCSVLFVALAGAGTASADIVTFDTYTGPNSFGAPEQNLTITGTSSGTVTISGGTLLTNAVGLLSDPSTVYGSCSPLGCGSNYSNTITLTFSSPIQNFFLDLYNGNSHTDTFTSSDNVGDTSTTSIAPEGQGNALISFAAAGTQVTVTTSDPLWNFEIDNVGFNQATPVTTTTPEPGTMTLLGTGAAALCGLLWNRKRLSLRSFA